MAALTATDWVVVVNPNSSTVSTAAASGPRSRPEGGRRRHYCKLILATAGSYPSNGIPQPAAGKLGMGRNVEYISAHDTLVNSTYRVKYDTANSSFRVFLATATSGPQLTEVATTVTVGASGGFIVYVEAVGW